MKKLLLTLSLISGFSLAIHSQNLTATTKPFLCGIVIYNNSNAAIETETGTIYPKHAQTINLSAQRSFMLQQGGNKYKVTCPYFKTDNQICLDFTTIQWFAGDNTLLCPNGLDEITIKNDTLYKIMVLYVLNKMRSVPRSVSPHYDTSKVVRNDDTLQEKTGSVEITDENKQKYTVVFPRKVVTRYNDNEWASVTLCANTIKLFNNGFTVTKVR